MSLPIPENSVCDLDSDDDDQQEGYDDLFWEPHALLPTRPRDSCMWSHRRENFCIILLCVITDILKFTEFQVHGFDVDYVIQCYALVSDYVFSMAEGSRPESFLFHHLAAELFVGIREDGVIEISGFGINYILNTVMDECDLFEFWYDHELHKMRFCCVMPVESDLKMLLVQAVKIQRALCSTVRLSDLAMELLYELSEVDPATFVPGFY
jgi:hypothetical protein